MFINHLCQFICKSDQTQLDWGCCEKTNLQQDPDFLFNGSLCLWALFGYVTVGHDTKLQQNTNYIIH